MEGGRGEKEMETKGRKGEKETRMKEREKNERRIKEGGNEIPIQRRRTKGKKKKNLRYWKRERGMKERREGREKKKIKKRGS